jgi:UV DNA damage endonuclease
MRVSSDLFPFASHPTYGYPLSYCLPLLQKAGDLAKKYGHRLTLHPGQFTQLGSPKADVIENSVRELKYHTEIMESMGIGKDGVLIVHVSAHQRHSINTDPCASQGGGMYGDKMATLERIKDTIVNVLPKNVRDRLVLENDEV